MLAGLSGMTLSINKAVFTVSEVPVYLISGAPPNATICWSSSKDGQPTGESGTCYGQKTDSNGEWQSAGNAWLPGNAGSWQKVASVYPQGSNTPQTATVSFQVRPAPTSGGTTGGATAPSASGAGGFFSGSVNLFGQNIPNVALAGGAILLVLALSGGKK